MEIQNYKALVRLDLFQCGLIIIIMMVIFISLFSQLMRLNYSKLVAI